MTGPTHRFHPVWLLLAALLCEVGMRVYFQCIVIPHQLADAAAHGRPRGNVSDLYPPWIGTRELLLHGRDPYSDDVTREIQIGFYSRPLNPARAEDPANEERFAYPLYVVFPLAPALLFRFDTFQDVYLWGTFLAIVLSVPLWLRLLHWRVSRWTLLSLMLFTLGSPGAMQALKLHQLSLLVMAWVFAAAFLLISGRQLGAGILLALATIKPQLLWLPVAWLALWCLSDWKRRYRLAVGFLVTMLALLVGSEVLLPKWILGFWRNIQEYPRYTGAASVVSKMVDPTLGVILAIVTAAATLWIGWREREQSAESEAFVRTLCLVLAASVFIAPTFVPYNQILLLPPALLLARDASSVLRRGGVELVLLRLTVVTLAWPWLCSIALAMLWLSSPGQADNFWTVPFWPVWMTPMVFTASMLLLALRSRSATARATQ